MGRCGKMLRMKVLCKFMENFSHMVNNRLSESIYLMAILELLDIMIILV